MLALSDFIAFNYKIMDQSINTDYIIKTINTYLNDGLRYESISRFTPSVGKTICAFLNTIGGRIKIKYDGEDYDKKSPN